MMTSSADVQEMGALVTRLNERVKSFKHTFPFETTLAEDRITAALVEKDMDRLRSYDRLLTKVCGVASIDFVVNFLKQRGLNENVIKDSDEVMGFISFYTLLRDNSRRYEPKSLSFEQVAELYFTDSRARNALTALITERKLYKLDDIRNMQSSIRDHHSSLGEGTL